MGKKRGKGAVLNHITFFCKNLEKYIDLEPGEVNFSGWTQERGPCGSHGGADASFSCECGEYHTVDLEEW